MNIKKITHPENINLEYVGEVDFYPTGMKEKIEDQKIKGFTPLFNLDLNANTIRSVWYPQHIEASKTDNLWRSCGARGISIGVVTKDNRPVFIRRSSLNSLNKGSIAPVAGHLKMRQALEPGQSINLKSLLETAVVSEIYQELGLIPDGKILIDWDSLELLEVSTPLKQHEFSVLVKIDLNFSEIEKLNSDMNFSDTTEVAEKIADPKEATKEYLSDYPGAEQHDYVVLKVLEHLEKYSK